MLGPSWMSPFSHVRESISISDLPYMSQRWEGHSQPITKIWSFTWSIFPACPLIVTNSRPFAGTQKGVLGIQLWQHGLHRVITIPKKAVSPCVGVTHPELMVGQAPPRFQKVSPVPIMYLVRTGPLPVCDPDPTVL